MTPSESHQAVGADGPPNTDPRASGDRPRGEDGSGAGGGRADSYYGRPVVKPLRWHVPNMPAYLFLGGLSGGASVMAAGAEATGRPRLALTGEITALLAGTAGAGLLVAELGRPDRFLNMLRVFKPTSPMSVGAWVLAAQGGLTAAAAGSYLTGVLPRVGRAAGYATAVTGPAMATYTAVLLADTAVPAWQRARRELPFLFAGSGMAAAGAIGMTVVPGPEGAPARRLAIAGATLEAAATAVLERGLGYEGEPYGLGRAGRFLRIGRTLSMLGAAGALLAGRNRGKGRAGRGNGRHGGWGGGRGADSGDGRALAAVSGLALLGGALCTRFGVFFAGDASARDPAYTVLPQRERREAVTTPAPDARDAT
ncbi:MAG: polysulfide reductase [Streptosporangiales bacterium]|nr:polysulfide reductase [Streptosporangiales bacterium]